MGYKPSIGKYILTPNLELVTLLNADNRGVTGFTSPTSERGTSSRTFSIGDFDGSAIGGLLSVEEDIIWFLGIGSGAGGK